MLLWLKMGGKRHLDLDVGTWLIGSDNDIHKSESAHNELHPHWWQQNRN